MRSVEIQEINDNTESLYSVIIDSNVDKVDKKVYIDANFIPYEFAGYDGTTDSYYIVMDEYYMYVVYMSVDDFNELNTEDIYDNPIRIDGITSNTPSDVKQLAIDAYNEAFVDNPLTIGDYDDYFGTVYLDMTIGDNTSTVTLLFVLFVLFGFLVVICLVTSVLALVRFSKSIKRLDIASIEELDKEMNDEDAFYYDKAHLYLTEHYVIHFSNGFQVLSYKDILWMYPYVMKTNGLKTSQSIKVLMNNGKTYTIATIDIITKKKRDL